MSDCRQEVSMNLQQLEVVTSCIEMMDLDIFLNPSEEIIESYEAGSRLIYLSEGQRFVAGLLASEGG